MTARIYLAVVLAVAAGFSGVIAYMIVDRARHIANGREVVIESGFVDPRDLFRGHYVTLNPVVGDLSAQSVETDSAFKRDEPVFVELEKGEGLYWTARKLWHRIPAGNAAPMLAGRIAQVDIGDDQRYRINFPIDRYFAEKSRAKELEKLRRDQKLGIVLALDETGKAYVKGLMIEGEIAYDEPLY